MKNHTPRTQDVINHIADNPDNLQPIFDHARRLEIELNAAKEQLRTEANRRKEAEADLATERKAKRDLAEVISGQDKELAAERARLDWLETDVGIDWQWEPSRLTVSRAAIDAAMKEETK